jgi:signal transduction histidine kinase
MQRNRATLWLSIALALIAAVLSGWQIHLVEERVESENKKNARQIDLAATSFAEALEFELTRAFEHFQIDYTVGVDYRTQFGEKLESWPRQFPYAKSAPRLFLVARESRPSQALEVRSDATTTPAAPLESFDSGLARRFADRSIQNRSIWFPLYLADPICAVGPVLKFRFRPPPTPNELTSLDLPFPAALALLFEREFIEAQLIPDLEQRWLKGDLGTMRHQLSYSADGTVPETQTAADVRRSVWVTGSWRAVPFGGARDETTYFPPRSEEFPDPDRWFVSLSHPAGSLALAQSQRRWSEYPVTLIVTLALAAASACAVWMAHRARRAVHQQIEFVAAVTHELNTPIAAIRGAAQNLTDQVVAGPHQVQLYGRMIESACDRLAAMVAQVLKYASIENAPIAVHREPTALEPLLRSVIASVSKLAAEEGVQLELTVDAALPRISTDPEALEVIVRNLLENAIKHGGTGGWVGIEVRTDADHSTTISVLDRGEGIAPEYRERIFEPFFRLPGRGADPPAAGSGLGLCIAQRLAFKLGATIYCEANSTQGVRFTVRFPYQATSSRRNPNDDH